MKIQFPETNYVECVFNVWQNSAAAKTGTGTYDDLGIAHDTAKLKRYLYEVPEYLKGQLQVGDFVVVRCVTGYQLTQIVSVNVNPYYDSSSYAPVVAKVDFKPFFEELQKKEELKRMRKALEEAKKSLESLVTYELIAEKSPEFKAMLDKYKEAGGTF